MLHLYSKNVIHIIRTQTYQLGRCHKPLPLKRSWENIHDLWVCVGREEPFKQCKWYVHNYKIQQIFDTHTHNQKKKKKTNKQIVWMLLTNAMWNPTVTNKQLPKTTKPSNQILIGNCFYFLPAIPHYNSPIMYVGTSRFDCVANHFNVHLLFFFFLGIKKRVKGGD